MQRYVSHSNCRSVFLSVVYFGDLRLNTLKY